MRPEPETVGRAALLVGPVRVLDPVARTVSDPVTLAVGGGLVTEMLTSDAVRPGEPGWLGEEPLFATPGLIDCHVHTASYETAARRPVRTPAATMALGALNLSLALANGITTVRDLGAPGDHALELRAAWTRRQVLGARPLVAGQMLCAPGGHGSAAGVGRVVDGVEQAIRAVDELAGAGVDVIKLAMASVARPVRHSDEVVRNAVEAAGGHGLPVAIHANFDVDSVRAAMACGAHTLEHGCVYLDVEAPVRRAFAERRGLLCPTLSVLHRVLADADELRAAGAESFLQQVEAGLAGAEESVRVATADGVHVIAGSDAGVGRHPFGSLHDEIALLRACGLDAWTALAAATSTAAAALGRDDLGRISVGAAADFVLTLADPIEDLACLREPVAVCGGGRLLQAGWIRAVLNTPPPAAGPIMGCCGP